MLLNEIKKLLFKQKLIIIILIPFLFSLFTFGGNTNHFTNNDMNYFKMVLNETKGEVNESKKQIINEYLAKSNNVYNQENNLITQLKNKEISLEEYNYQIDLIKVYSVSNANLTIQRQLNHVLENPNNRQMIIPDQWTMLFRRLSFHRNFVLLLVVIIIAMNLFINDFNTNVHNLLIITKNGRKKLFKYRLVLMYLMIVITCSCVFLIDYLKIKTTYGLDYGNAPIQSLVSLANLSYSLSLNQFLLIIFLIKIFGYIVLATFICYLTLKNKSAINSFFIGIGVVFFSYYTNMALKNIYYQIPLLTHLLDVQQTNFLNTKIFGIDALLITIIFYLIVFINLIFISYKLYCNQSISKKFKFNKVIIVFLIIGVLSGCNKTNLNIKNNSFNNNDRFLGYYQDNFYFWYNNQIFLLKNKITYQIKPNFIKEEQGFKNHDLNLFYNDKHFLLFEDDLVVNYYDNNINKVNKIIGNEKSLPVATLFFGLISFQTDTMFGNYLNLSLNSKVIDDYFIYFSNNKISIYDLINDKIIFNYQNNYEINDFVIDNNYLYLLDNQFNLKIIDLNTKKIVKQFNEPITKISNDQQNIYFVSLYDNYLYQMNKNDYVINLINEIEVVEFNYNENYIYIIDQQKQLYQINKITTEIRVIANDVLLVYCFDGIGYPIIQKQLSDPLANNFYIVTDNEIYPLPDFIQ